MPDPPSANLPRQDFNKDQASVSAWIARALQARGVKLVFGLQGGHIQSLWDHIARAGIRIIDVRDERAAVHMAHAQSELTGQIGIALATAGPGVTNTVTAIANASISRIPLVLIGGCASTPQANMGALQAVPHIEIMRPITRYARTAQFAEQVLRELNEAFACARGDMGEPGPAYIEVPADVLRQTVPDSLILEDWIRPPGAQRQRPDLNQVDNVANAIKGASRVLVISGRGAKGHGDAMARFLKASQALYLDTQESRGLVPPEHFSVVGSVRAVAMSEANLVITVGRKLDYQLGFGSPAVFPNASFVRIADNAGELIDNRRGSAELRADVGLALDAVAEVLDATGAGGCDQGWIDSLCKKHRERIAQSGTSKTPDLGADGKINPMAIFEAIRQVVEPDCIGIADGGDLLSFARIGLQTQTYLDAGAFGCLGVGVPFAVAASLVYPERQVISVNGDGAFGLNALEIDTAVRHGAKAVFVVSNNAAWNIERIDQDLNYGGRVVGTLLEHSDYAAMARALGAHGERVERPGDLLGAIKHALQHAPAVVDVVTSREVVSSDARKGLGFVPDYQPLLAWDEAEKRRRTGIQ